MRPEGQDLTHRRYRARGIGGRDRAGEEPDQVQGAGVRHWRQQASIRLRVLSRPAEERPSPVRRLRARQSLHRVSPSAALAGSVVCPSPSQEGASTRRALSGGHRL
jgi:hypothetical protein